jgi:hypothetical protein
MPHDARMTMKRKMLRGLIAGLVGLGAGLAAMGGGGLPGSAASCQRSIAIDPQVTVSEASRTLTFVVHTNACIAPGSVSFTTVDGTAQRQVQGLPGDYILESGVLVWPAGDLSSRQITAVIVGDLVRENPLEDFRVMLVNPSSGVRIAGQGFGQGRIFDDDGQPRAAVTDDRICLISGEKSCLPPQPSGGGSAPKHGPTIIQTIEPGHLVSPPIVLNAPNTTGTTVHFQTIDGGLTGGVDFVPVNRDVFIPPGVTVVYVDIELLAPAYSQPGESFYTQISAYPLGLILDPMGVVTMVA